MAADGLKEIALLFLRLGTTAFGGPAAHIAMMEDEVVRRRRWLAREEFLDLLGATNLIPGPNSTEMAIHIGYAARGLAPGWSWRALCFILPGGADHARRWRGPTCASATLPQADGLLYGVKPVVIAIVVQALWGLGRTAVKDRAAGRRGGRRGSRSRSSAATSSPCSSAAGGRRRSCSGASPSRRSLRSAWCSLAPRRRGGRGGDRRSGRRSVSARSSSSS